MPPWQNLVAQRTGAPTPLNTAGLCLLSLDGGGVRGLAILYTLNSVMSMLNELRKKESLSCVKPCEVFDLIGGTSTGGYGHGRLEQLYVANMRQSYRYYAWSAGDDCGRVHHSLH